MKPSLFLLSVAVISTGWANHPSVSQCVQADVSVQYSIRSSKQPTERSNDVTMKPDPECSGNASITTGIQGYRGDQENLRQQRRIRQVQQGGQSNRSGIEGNTVQIRSNVQKDFYLPRLPNKVD